MSEMRGPATKSVLPLRALAGSGRGDDAGQGPGLERTGPGERPGIRSHPRSRWRAVWSWTAGLVWGQVGAAAVWAESSTIRTPGVRIRYTNYDWSLNEQPGGEAGESS